MALPARDDRATDPYRTLGVARGCTHDEVREAYRTLALAAHPDRGGEEVSFIQLRAAYEEIVADLDRRALAEPPPQPSEVLFEEDGRWVPADPTTCPDRGWAGDPTGIRFLDEAPDPTTASLDEYREWIDRVASDAMRRDPRRRGRWVRFTAVVVFLCVILGLPVGLTVGFVANLPDVVKIEERGGSPAEALGVLLGLPVMAVPVLAVWIAWKYRDV